MRLQGATPEKWTKSDEEFYLAEKDFVKKIIKRIIKHQEAFENLGNFFGFGDTEQFGIPDYDKEQRNIFSTIETYLDTGE